SGGFTRERGAALGGDLVVLGPAIVAREAPGRFEQLALLEPVKGRVERAFLDAEHVAGHVLDPTRDVVAVRRAPGEGLEDEEVERSLEEVERRVHRRLR